MPEQRDARKILPALTLGFAVAIGCGAVIPASAKSPIRKVERRWMPPAFYLDRPVFYRPEETAWSFDAFGARAKFDGRPFGFGNRPHGWEGSYLR